MPKAQVLILAEAVNHIEDFLAENSRYRDELLVILERIKAIEHVVSTWSRAGGRLAYAKGMKEHLKEDITITQQSLLDEYEKAFKGKKEFGEIAVRKLLGDFDKISDRRNIARDTRIQSARECIQSVLNVMQADMLSDESVPLDKHQKSASLFDARYIAFSQADDPLRGQMKQNGKLGKFDGMCHGNVMEWKDEIAQAGAYLKTPHYTQKVRWYQSSQGARPYQSVHNVDELQKFLDKEIDNMRTGRVYELGQKDRESGHATGIALYPSGEVEFFDSNNMLIVFPDRERFKAWIVPYLQDYYGDFLNDSGQAVITQIGTLPKKTKPTIPKVKSSPDEKADAVYELFTSIMDVTDVDSINKAIETTRYCFNLDKKDEAVCTAMISALKELDDKTLGGEPVFAEATMASISENMLQFHKKIIDYHDKKIDDDHDLSLDKKEQLKKIGKNKWISYLQKKEGATTNENDRIKYYLALAYLDLVPPQDGKAFSTLSKIKSQDHFQEHERDQIQNILRENANRHGWFRRSIRNSVQPAAKKPVEVQLTEPVVDRTGTFQRK